VQIFFCGLIVIKMNTLIMPFGCGYHMLLGNEFMTTLHADIMQSLKVVCFQVGNCVTLVSALPKEAHAGHPIEFYFKVDCSEP
jgi:hypothetical protein